MSSEDFAGEVFESIFDAMGESTLLGIFYVLSIAVTAVVSIIGTTHYVNKRHTENCKLLFLNEAPHGNIEDLCGSIVYGEIETAYGPAPVVTTPAPVVATPDTVATPDAVPTTANGEEFNASYGHPVAPTTGEWGGTEAETLVEEDEEGIEILSIEPERKE